MGINLNPEHRNLGQQTGGTTQDDQNEARVIMGMISKASVEDVEEVAGERAAEFVRDRRVDLSFGPQDGSALRVTGKQLFWLRDIKDKLLDGGKI